MLTRRSTLLQTKPGPENVSDNTRVISRKVKVGALLGRIS